MLIQISTFLLAIVHIASANTDVITEADFSKFMHQSGRCQGSFGAYKRGFSFPDSKAQASQIQSEARQSITFLKNVMDIEQTKFSKFSSSKLPEIDFLKKHLIMLDAKFYDTLNTKFVKRKKNRVLATHAEEVKTALIAKTRRLRVIETAIINLIGNPEDVIPAEQRARVHQAVKELENQRKNAVITYIKEADASENYANLEMRRYIATIEAQINTESMVIEADLFTVGEQLYIKRMKHKHDMAVLRYLVGILEACNKQMELVKNQLPAIAEVESRKEKSSGWKSRAGVIDRE